MLVRDIATTKTKTVTPEFALRNVMDLLRNNDFRHVPVVDEARSVEAVLSQTDLASSASMARHFGSDREAYEAFLEMPVGEFLKTRFTKDGDVVVVDPDAPVEEAIRLLLDHRLSALPVVEEDGTLFGIVSYVDILEAVRDEDSDTLRIDDG